MRRNADLPFAPSLAAPDATRRLTRLFVVTVLLGLVAALLAPALSTGAIGAQTVRWRRPVATRAIARGDTLDAGAIAWRDTLLTHDAPRLAPTDTLVPRSGWIARRAVAAGEWLRVPAVVPPPLVTAGHAVVAVREDDAVRLVLRGTAVRSAAHGERVVVRIGTRRLDGIAVAPDTVRLR
jgi:flagella basal body P-ring formation protein FlgA